MSNLRRLSPVPPSPRCEAGEERAGECAAGRRGCSDTRRSNSLSDYPELGCGNASSNVVEGCGESGRNGTKVVALIRAAGSRNLSGVSESHEAEEARGSSLGLCIARLRHL